jgi:hypothetical protein
MKDCFGLKGVKAFLNIPFLKLQVNFFLNVKLSFHLKRKIFIFFQNQRQKLQEKLQWNQEELEKCTFELEYICKEESNYDAYVHV